MTVSLRIKINFKGLNECQSPLVNLIDTLSVLLKYSQLLVELRYALLNLNMLCNIAIDYENFEGLLELSIAKFEKSCCILVISDFLNGWPFQIKLRKLDCLLL